MSPYRTRCASLAAELDAPASLTEFRALTETAIAAERWVLDGNYHQVRDLVWGRATTVIWLNYPFPLVFWRALTRTTRRVLWQKELYNGNRETFRLAFLSRESILWWVVTTYHRRRREYPALFKQLIYAHLQVIELHTPVEAKWLALQR